MYLNKCLWCLKKREKLTACKVRSVIYFLNVSGYQFRFKQDQIHHQIYYIYGGHAMTNSIIRRFMQLFNQIQENMHTELQLSFLSEDLVQKKFKINKQFIITSLSLYFPQNCA